MECPKCGRTVEEGAFICPGCEFILDTTFLGDDITDDERDRRPKAVVLPIDFGQDAMILGDGVGEYDSFETGDAGVSRVEVTNARFYMGGSLLQMLAPETVPELVPGVVAGSLRITPFERHVLGFVNGKRSVGRIQKKSAMEEVEFKTALAMLSDKGIIRPGPKKKKKTARSRTLSREGSIVSEESAPIAAHAERTVLAALPAEPPRAQALRSRSFTNGVGIALGNLDQLNDSTASHLLKGDASVEAMRRPRPSDARPEATVVQGGDDAEARNEPAWRFASMRIDEGGKVAKAVMPWDAANGPDPRKGSRKGPSLVEQSPVHDLDDPSEVPTQLGSLAGAPAEPSGDDAWSTGILPDMKPTGEVAPRVGSSTSSVDEAAVARLLAEAPPWADDEPFDDDDQVTALVASHGKLAADDVPTRLSTPRPPTVPKLAPSARAPAAAPPTPPRPPASSPLTPQPTLTAKASPTSSPGSLFVNGDDEVDAAGFPRDPTGLGDAVDDGEAAAGGSFGEPVEDDAEPDLFDGSLE